MTIDDLVDQCWEALPPFRKRLAGRDSVRQVVLDAVREWSPEYLEACRDEAQQGEYVTQLCSRIKARHVQQQEYGFVLMTIILTAVLSAVIQWLVKWWLDNHFHRELMAQWQAELAK